MSIYSIIRYFLFLHNKSKALIPCLIALDINSDLLHLLGFAQKNSRFINYSKDQKKHL